MKKQTLEFFDRLYGVYKINIVTEGVQGLPDYLYAQPNTTLDVGDGLPAPTRHWFSRDTFNMIGRFGGVEHTLYIPYDNLFGIFDFDMNEGVIFVYKVEPVEQPKPINQKLKIVN